jgi:FkbM family methyltransferase
MNARYLFRAFKARYRDQRSEFRAILPVLHRGDVAVDVGANKGSYLYWMRKAVGAGGKVFAFEPQTPLAAYLRSVCAAMRWENVIVHDCAVSDITGIGTLHVPGNGDSPGASLHPAVLGDQPGQRSECRTDTLDHQLADVARVALLKVDVEGHELQVFRGATRILSRDRPLILFECEARHLQGHLMRDVFSCLENLGYEGEFFSPQGLRPLDDFDPAIHQKHESERFWDAPGYCNNFLFKARA